jgi:hypothetical protein
VMCITTSKPGSTDFSPAGVIIRYRLYLECFLAILLADSEYPPISRGRTTTSARIGRYERVLH